MDKATDRKIIAQCAVKFPSEKDDCNGFLKAVSNVFFEPDLFSGSDMNADRIIDTLNSDAKWEKLGKVHKTAVDRAKTGKFVIAGMKSNELSSAHGHVAVIISDDMQNSGTVPVPICYAGSINNNARVARGRVSGTFGVTPARESKISYFARAVDTVPVDDALDLVVNYLRGDRGEIETRPVKKAPAKSAKRSRRIKSK